MQNYLIDWKETPNAHVLKADVPGLKKGGGEGESGRWSVLQIKGDTWNHVERSSEKFMRRCRLSGNAKVDQVKAVTVPSGMSRSLISSLFRFLIEFRICVLICQCSVWLCISIGGFIFTTCVCLVLPIDNSMLFSKNKFEKLWFHKFLTVVNLNNVLVTHPRELVQE